MKEHNLTKEQMRGKEVHHFDGDSLNDDIDNLILVDKTSHQKIEKNVRFHKNLNIAYFMLTGLSLFCFIAYKIIDNANEIYYFAGLCFLLISFIVRGSPHMLRKILFKLGILKKHEEDF